MGRADPSTSTTESLSKWAHEGIYTNAGEVPVGKVLTPGGHPFQDDLPRQWNLVDMIPPIPFTLPLV